MRVLVVEDEEKLATFIQQGLKEHAFVVDVVDTAEDALEYTLANAYDAILLDLMLPGMSGLDLVRELRSRGRTTPVLALTARVAVEDRVAGLYAGCDDYMPKPFAFEELVARLRALARRSQPEQHPALEYAGLRLDLVTRTVTRDGRRIELTNREFALLELLLRRPHQVFTRTTILERVWGYDYDAESNILEVYVNFLRKKIDQGHARKLLHTVRGVGYVLREEPE
jgi:DNA-binding response OmpR family regulator